MDHRWLPGAWGERPEFVHAGVARSEVIREMERELESFGLLAVQIDARVNLDTAQVRNEAIRRFRVPFYELGASRIAAATFLLRFGTQQQRDAAHRCRELQIGHTKLHLMPWKRQFSSKDLSKFYYRVRLCIEGVPSHARHAEAVAGLFKVASFFDDLDCPREKPEEEECLCLWLWTSDPDGIATRGVLHIEEPVSLPEEGYAESLSELGMPMGAMRTGAAEALEYEVLIHVDRVLDFSPPPARPSSGYPDSPVSGRPDDPEEEWPLSHPFSWRLGVPDGEILPQPARRISVHDRLGGRDRSPPPGGAGGMGGRRRVPSPGPHAASGISRGSRKVQGASSSGRHGGRQHVDEQVSGDPVLSCQPKGKAYGPTSSTTEDSFLPDESKEQCEQWVRQADPMLEEAARTPCLSVHQTARPQRSVEPTAATAALVLPEVLDGELGLGKHLLVSEDGRKSPTALQDENRQANILQDPISEEIDLPSDPVQQDDVLLVNPPEKEKGITGCPGGEVIDAQHNALKDPVADLGYGPNGQLGRTPLECSSITAEDLGQCSNFGPSLAPLATPTEGLAFDLNLSLDPLEGVVPTHDAEATAKTTRPVLGGAEERLNKEGRDHGGCKTTARGVAMFAVPLKRALLCNPAARQKLTHAKKNVSSELPKSDRKGNKPAAKGTTTLPIEEQATALLLKACGVMCDNGKPTDTAVQQFGLKFANPLQADLMGDVRNQLGLSAEGGVDTFGALVGDAEE
ncbi:unnamed protein product [Urochloa humidicola]